MSGSGQYRSVSAYNGTIYTSSDYGVTWTLQATVSPQGGGAPCFSLSMSATGQYAIGAGGTDITYVGHVLISTDYGMTWVNVADNGTSGLTSVDRYWASSMSATGQNMFVSIIGGSGYISTDYGNTWSLVFSSYAVNGSAMSASSQYITIGTGNGVYTSEVSLIGATGADTQILFNNAGTAAGSAALTFNNTTGTTTVSALTVGTIAQTYSGSTVGFTINGRDTVGGTGFTNFLRVTNTTAGATNPTKTFRINQVGALGIVNNAYNSEIFSVTDGGILQVGGGNSSATLNNSPTTNYLLFNNNGSSIYDDGNFHIHTRNTGGSMWINTSGGQINMISQPIDGGSLGTGVGIGTATLTAYVTINGTKTYSINNYGYLISTGAGNVVGNSGNVGYSLYASGRIQATEFDATSDERLKNISGAITADDAVRFVQSVSGMYYSWKSDPSANILSGFIAQDIHKSGYAHMVSAISNADLVGQVDDDGYTHPDKAQLTLNYSAITPYHHEAIKVLLDRVAKLETQVSNLMSSK